MRLCGDRGIGAGRGKECSRLIGKLVNSEEIVGVRHNESYISTNKKTIKWETVTPIFLLRPIITKKNALDCPRI